MPFHPLSEGFEAGGECLHRRGLVRRHQAAIAHRVRRENGGQTVLGGSDDLRGFRPYRFYGDQQILLNAEYRWESFTGLEMAAFFDAGKVVQERSDINFQDLETSAGFGFRFNMRNNTFIRIDTGFSREGFQVWFKFANPF